MGKRKTKGKEVKIPTTLYEKLSVMAAAKGLTVSDLANQLLQRIMS